MGSVLVRGALSIVLGFALAGGAAAAWRSEGPFIGNLHDLACDPSHPDTVYAATSGGGVWRSDDGGATWSLPGGEMTNRKVLWVEVDPASPSTVWAGVDNPGEPSLWRSRDRGGKWELVTGPVKGELGDMSPTGKRIAFAPSAPTTIFVPSTNLHYRSTDGGKTWTDFRVPGQDAYAMAIDPQNPKLVYAGGRGEKLHFSRSEDGGKTWKQSGQGLPERSIQKLLVTPKTGATLYASVGFAELFASTDRGDTWQTLPSPAQGTDDLYNLELDPNDPKALWAATENGLFRSADGGQTWTQTDRGTGRYLCTDVAIDPRDSKRVLAATGGTGVYRSTDGGRTWTPSSRGLAAGWIERLWVPPHAGPVFARTATGLFRREDDGAWTGLATPFAAHGEEAKIDGILFDRSVPGGAWAFATAKLWRSADGGASWQEMEQKGPSMRDLMKGNVDSAEFQSLAQDPGNPKVLYAGSWSNESAGGGAVYKSVDAGKTWKPSGKGIPDKGVLELLAAGPGTLYALAAEHSLYRTSDGAATWTASGNGLPDAKIRQIAIDPTTPTRLFVATEKGLFRSTDGGGSWAQVRSGLESDDVEAVVVAPSGTVFAGIFEGVFRSPDGGTNWSAMNGGLPNTDVRALAIGGEPARLWAGTAGDSVYSIELP